MFLVHFLKHFCISKWANDTHRLDIIHLTGLSGVGTEVNAALDHQPFDPPFEFEGSSSYANFLAKHVGPDDDEPSFNEKIAFYLYWLNKYLMCVSGVKITKKYIRLAQGNKLIPHLELSYCIIQNRNQTVV